MAKVLICADGFFRAFSPYALEPYIESFISSLVKNGNEVLPYIFKDFETKKKIKRYFRGVSARSEILAFNPDLIIAFNNALDPVFAKKLSCPIFVIASDRPVYWRHKDFIKKNLARYAVGFFNKDMAQDLKEQFSIPLKKQVLIPYSTSIKTDSTINPKYDITFIGNFYNPSTFLPDFLLKNLKFYSKEKLEKLHNFISDICDMIIFKKLDESCFEKKLKELNLTEKEFKKSDELISNFLSAITCEIRQKNLNAISDLDLHIWTWDANLRILANNTAIFKKCHLDTIYSTEGLQKVYNYSKISLNMPHAQVNKGFSWRVCDILASNALLLSNPSEDLSNLFEGIVPTYKDEKDLRDKSLYYLKNTKERKDIVKQCNQIVDKNHRYENVFKVIEAYYGLSLLGKNSGKGNLLKLSRTKKKEQRYLKNMEKDKSQFVERIK